MWFDHRIQCQGPLGLFPLADDKDGLDWYAKADEVLNLPYWRKMWSVKATRCVKISEVAEIVDFVKAVTLVESVRNIRVTKTVTTAELSR